jgi:hypothetical protein
VFMVIMVLSYILFGPLYMLHALRRAKDNGDVPSNGGTGSGH